VDVFDQAERVRVHRRVRITESIIIGVFAVAVNAVWLATDLWYALAFCGGALFWLLGCIIVLAVEE
jgi:uncharacterized membrane protein YagU involved in acid resistance